MAFDPKVVEAQIALNMIGTTDMPRLAWDALEAGFDGPAIRRLAALDFPTHFKVDKVLPKAMEEMHLAKMSREEAALQLAKIKAKEALRGGDDPLKHLGCFYSIWKQSGYTAELAEAADLGEEVNSALASGRPVSEIRAWVLDRLRALAEA